MSDGSSPPPFKRNRVISEDYNITRSDDIIDTRESIRVATIQKLLSQIKLKRAESAQSRKRLRDEVDFEVLRLKKMVDSIGEILNRDLDRIYAEDDTVLEDLETELHNELTLPRFGISDTLLKRAHTIANSEKKYDIYRSDNVSDKTNTTERVYTAKYTIESRCKRPSLSSSSSSINHNNQQQQQYPQSSTSPIPTVSTSPTLQSVHGGMPDTITVNSDTDTEYNTEVIEIERPKAYVFKLLAECNNAIPTESKEKVIARLKAKGTEWASQCAWKECPVTVSYPKRYSVSGTDRRTATMVHARRTTQEMSTVLGDTPLPRDAISEWSIQILHSRKGTGCCILVGVSPANVDQNSERNFEKSGWYFYCYDSNITTGPPHRFTRKPYGPRKQVGTYVKEGDFVGVVFDTRSSVTGTLSFVLGGVNRGVAVEGIPLDVPLVPAVILIISEDSVMFIPGGKKHQMIQSNSSSQQQQQQQCNSYQQQQQQQNVQQQQQQHQQQVRSIHLPPLLPLHPSIPLLNNNNNNSSLIVKNNISNDYEKSNIDYLLN